MNDSHKSPELTLSTQSYTQTHSCTHATLVWQHVVKSCCPYWPWPMRAQLLGTLSEQQEIARQHLCRASERILICVWVYVRLDISSTDINVDLFYLLLLGMLFLTGLLKNNTEVTDQTHKMEWQDWQWHLESNRRFWWNEGDLEGWSKKVTENIQLYKGYISKMWPRMKRVWYTLKETKKELLLDNHFITITPNWAWK